MAAPGGAKAPDYRPRPAAGAGAAANRQDLTDGRHAGVGQTDVTGAPTPPVTGTGGAYGQRQELTQLAGGTPMAGRRGSPVPGSSPPPSGGGPDQADEPVLPPLATMPDGVTAAYTDADVQQLELLLPYLHQMAAQPDASDGVRELFNLAGEVVVNHQAATQPVPQPLGPAPEWSGGP